MRPLRTIGLNPKYLHKDLMHVRTRLDLVGGRISFIWSPGEPGHSFGFTFNFVSLGRGPVCLANLSDEKEIPRGTEHTAVHCQGSEMTGRRSSWSQLLI